jgi:hypothetical protein
MPAQLNYHHDRDRIANVVSVHNVHELHIWSFDSALRHSVSVNKSMHDAVLEQIYNVVRRECGIIHATIQIQRLDGDWITCADRPCCSCIDETTMINIKADPNSSAELLV